MRDIDFRSLFESVPGLYLVLNRELTIVAVTDTYLQATMTVRDEIVGRHIFDVFPDNPADTVSAGVHNLRSSLLRVIEKGAQDVMPVQKYDIQRPKSEGGGFEERYWSPINSPVLGPEREVLFIIHRVADVTDFIRAQKAGDRMETEIFRRSKELAEVNRQLRASNQAMQDLHQQISQLMAQADTDLEVAQKVPFVISPRTSEEMLGRVGKLISARKQAEDQLRQTQKLDAIGHLAGGIAHDFNNLLTAILGYNQLLADEVRDRPVALEFADEVRLASEKAAALTFQLLAFSRRQVMQLQLLDLSHSVGNMDRMLRRIIGEDIELQVHTVPGLHQVKADTSQVDQLILNLAVNARDAMPDGGRLIIETANVELTGEYSGGYIGIKPGAYVMLAVSDSGRGMDDATKSHIFEPFFTTKEPGKGTGMGLSIVYGIVKQNGGEIFVHSEVGLGSVFKIYLPAVMEKVEQDVGNAAQRSDTASGETILLVEDEHQVRHMTGMMLKRKGYSVLEADSGEQALEFIRDRVERIDLLLSDIVMPKMRGTELAKLAAEIRPGLKVLYMSGYTDTGILNGGGLQPGHAFIQKPFTPMALHVKVQKTLAEKTVTDSAK